MVDPISCAVFLLAAFTLAGAAHTAWLTTAASKGFAQPLDAGLTFRGRRLLGANKTVKGFVVMVPAAAVSFVVLAAATPASAGLWSLSLGGYAALGALTKRRFTTTPLVVELRSPAVKARPAMSFAS